MQPGIPLALAINVAQKADCGTSPLNGAYVDIWQCSASGVYFLTLHPASYQGRAVHIHIKVRTFNGGSRTGTITENAGPGGPPPERG